MSLPAGLRLGPYEIIAALGAGGMGEVYKARDTRLDRIVAVKILPPALATDPQFRERFDREARAISQLTHPHICRLYDVGEHDGTAFLVMEMLDGELLATRLEKGAMPVDQALTISIGIASALDAAHRAGIVHRDLKPGNVMLTKSGAKLLDFGLAKITGPAVATSGLSMAPTTPPATMAAAGTILGTFQYMSLEQIEGADADARTDVFALGCVLYEMLTGRKAFEGKTRASLLGAILKDDPQPVSQVQPIAPPSLDRIVATCLAKDPDDRWQNVRDLMRELQWVATPPGDSMRSVPKAANRSIVRLLIGTAVVTAAIVGVAVWTLVRQAPVAPRVVRLQATLPATTRLHVDGPSTDLAFAPDGTRLAFIAGAGGQSQLYLREIAQDDATPIAGIVDARGPFFSPDGEWIGFFSGGGYGDLKRVSVRGGPPITVCSGCGLGNRGASWGEDDTIVFSPGGGSRGLARVSAAGGKPIALTTVDPGTGEAHVWPEFLPGGHAILFTIATLGSTDNAVVAIRDLRSGAQTIVVRGASQPHYVPPGYLAFAVAGTVRVVGFNLSRLTAEGNPIPAIDHVVVKPNGAADFAVARDGSLAYIGGDAESIANRLRLVWVDRQGHEEALPVPTRIYIYPRLSPDGQRLALDIRDQQNDIWIWDFGRGVLTRLTTDPALDFYPVWSPDGRRVAFASARAGGPSNLYWQPADGTGAAERLSTTPHTQYPYAFTPDGKTLVLRDTDPNTGTDISIMSMDGERKITPLIHTPFMESNAELSPDARWIAYQSNESGRDEIHVRPFPGVDAGHWQVSTDGGTKPLWARSGRELFYMDLQGRIWSVPVQIGATFATATPAVVADNVAGDAPGRSYDASPDGRRLLVVRSAAPTGNTSPLQLNVVLNWADEVKRLATPKQ